MLRCLSITFSLFILITSCKPTNQQPADENGSPLSEQPNNLQEIQLTGDAPSASEPHSLTKAQSLPNCSKSSKTSNTKEEENKCVSKDSNEGSCSPIRKLKEKAKSMFSTPVLTKDNEQGTQPEAVQEQPKKEEAKDKKKTKEENKKRKQEEKKRRKEEKKKQEKEKKQNKGKKKEKKSKKEQGGN